MIILFSYIKMYNLALASCKIQFRWINILNYQFFAFTFGYFGALVFVLSSILDENKYQNTHFQYLGFLGFFLLSNLIFIIRMKSRLKTSLYRK